MPDLKFIQQRIYFIFSENQLCVRGGEGGKIVHVVFRYLFRILAVERGGGGGYYNPISQLISGHLTLFYTRGLGIIVSHVMVPLPYRFSL